MSAGELSFTATRTVVYRVKVYAKDLGDAYADADMIEWGDDDIVSADIRVEHDFDTPFL